MQVSVEKVNEVERRLTVIVPANHVEEAYTKQIANFAKKANIKGFRPGKAPMNVIQQRFGDDARREALNEVIQNSLYAALTEQKLNPVSTPRVEPKSLLANQPLEFVASIEVLPEISKVNFTLDEVEKLTVAIDESDIDRVIDQLKLQYTKWNLKDREAKQGDRVVVDYYPIFEGKEELENKSENFPLEVGGNRMLPGFEDGVAGMKAGDEKRLSLVFPDDYQIKEKAGKPVEFVVTMKQVYEPEAPDFDQKLLNQLGVKSGNVDDLKKQIRDSLELERDRLVAEKVKEQVFNKILELNPLEVPKSMVEREAKNIHDEIYPQQHDHHNHSGEEMTAFNEIAKKRVALGLLIAEYAKQVELKADEERVEKRIKEIASVYEKPQEVVEWLSGKERRSGIESQVMEDQVVDKLLDGIPVKDKKMSYADLKGIRI